MVYGPEGTGKTYFALSVLDWLNLVQGLKVEDLCIRIIDTDHGVEPILDHFNLEYYSCIEISTPRDFGELEKACNYFIKECKEWQEQKVKELGAIGIYTAWVICDTIAGWWDGSTGAQEWYSKSKRGMSLTEVALDEDERLDPRDDYRVINPMHNYLADRLKGSGVNFIWTAPSKDVYGVGKEKYKKLGKKPAGQKLNTFRVDNVIYLHQDSMKPQYIWAFLEKSRDVTHQYGGTPEDRQQAKPEDKDRILTCNRVTYIKHMRRLEQCRTIDIEDRKVAQKKLVETLKAKGIYHGDEADEADEAEAPIKPEPEPDNDNEKPKSIKRPEPITESEEVDASLDLSLDL